MFRLIAIILFISLSNAPGQIKLAVSLDHDPKNGITTNVTASNAATGASQAIHFSYVGVIRDVQFNESKSLCAINFKPGTEVNEIYLITKAKAGRLSLNKNFNKSIRGLILFHSSPIETDYIHVDKISGDTLSMSAGTRGEDNFVFGLKIGEDNKLKLVPGTLEKID